MVYCQKLHIEHRYFGDKDVLHGSASQSCYYAAIVSVKVERKE